MKTLIQFLKKHIALIIIIIAAASLGIFKFLKRKPKDQTATSLGLMNGMGLSSEDMNRLNNIALNVAHHLGTAYAKYDPRHWTENDKEVYEFIKDVTQAEFDVIATLYHDVYAKGHTLSSDLAKLLDSTYYELLIIK